METKNSHDIFISYSRKDIDAVKLIKEELEANGFSCWMDLDGIESGSREFTQKIIDAIDVSTVLLFFLSENSQKSEWALKEIDYAKDERKHVVLVRINDDPMTKKFRFNFGRTDIIDWRKPEQKEKLLRDLRTWADKVKESHGTHSQTATPTPSTELVKTQSEGSFVTCPVCGKKNNPVDTFLCRVCGRDNLCLRHQDEATFLCSDCKARTMHGGVGTPYPPDAFGDTHKKVQLWENGPCWAETNIGAENPWDPGYYFWWGDTVGYKREKVEASGLFNRLFGKETTVWATSDGSSSRFAFEEGNTPTCNKDISTLRCEGWITADVVLAPKHDAAHVQWGGSWRMPTAQELKDLYRKCEWTWTTVKGMNGYVVRGRNDFSSSRIFLPAAGFGYGASLGDAGSNGYYWSSSPDSDNSRAWDLDFSSSDHDTSSSYRGYGRTVRPVQGFANVPSSHDEKSLK